jgi:hypothetical protein
MLGIRGCRLLGVPLDNRPSQCYLGGGEPGKLARACATIKVDRARKSGRTLQQIAEPVKLTQLDLEKIGDLTLRHYGLRAEDFWEGTRDHDGIVTEIRACGRAGGSLAKAMSKISYSGYRFPSEIIQHAIWLYLRFTLSFRDVEDLLAEREIMVSYETVRRWVNYFGPRVAADLRKRRSPMRPGISTKSI